MPEAKPYNIPKQLVMEAYQRVKANQGAGGVDGETLMAFEKDLKGNLSGTSAPGVHRSVLR